MLLLQTSKLWATNQPTCLQPHSRAQNGLERPDFVSSWERSTGAQRPALQVAFECHITAGKGFWVPTSCGSACIHAQEDLVGWEEKVLAQPSNAPSQLPLLKQGCQCLSASGDHILQGLALQGTADGFLWSQPGVITHGMPGLNK